VAGTQTGSGVFEIAFSMPDAHKGRGRGGSVRRRVTEAAEQATPLPEPRLRESEVSLYSPLLGVLQGEWARDMRIAPHQIHFEETAKQGKKATGGT